MARPRKNAIKTEAPKAEIVGSTMDSEKVEEKTGSNVVTLAVSLRGGHRFTDVPNGQGGTKTVYLAGLDDALRGKPTGVLAPDGNCVFQTIDRTDWENILAMHGRERMFTGWNGSSPCVFEISGGVKNKAAYKDEIENTATGLAPLDPTADKNIAEANA